MYLGIYAYVYPIFNLSEVIFPYALHPFNIVKEYPELWDKIKKIFHVSNILVFFIINYMTITGQILKQ